MGHSAISEFETLKDVVAAGRNRDGTVLNILRRPAPYSYHKLCTNVWKAGNLLGHYGVHAVGELTVGVGPKSIADQRPSDITSPRDGEGTLDAAEPLLAILGGAIIGAVVDLTPTEPVDGPALVAPAHWDVEVTPGCSRLAYGGPPTDSDITHFERAVWSENPIEPPEGVGPDDEALRFDAETWTHQQLLESTGELVETYGIDSETTMVVTASLLEPGSFVAGILAPLAVGGTIVVPDRDESKETDPEELAEAHGDHSIVVTTETDGTSLLSAADVTRSMRDAHRV